MLLFVCAPTTVTDPNPPLTSASNQRLSYMGFCGLDQGMPCPDGTLDFRDDLDTLMGLAHITGEPTEPITALSVERLRWMDFCGMDMTTMRPDGTISVADQYHFVGLIQGLGEDDDDRLLLLGVS